MNHGAIGASASAGEEGDTSVAPMMKRQPRHIPVLMDEVLEALQPRAGETIADCTLGLGGHAAELLRHITPGGKLIGFDFDPLMLL